LDEATSPRVKRISGSRNFFRHPKKTLQRYLPKPEVASAWRYLLVTLETSLKIRRPTIHKLDFGGDSSVGARAADCIFRASASRLLTSGSFHGRMNYNAQKLAGEVLAVENRLLSRAIGCARSSDAPAGMHFISFRLNSQRVAPPW
jgi:hypothetical protein